MCATFRLAARTCTLWLTLAKALGNFSFFPASNTVINRRRFNAQSTVGWKGSCGKQRLFGRRRKPVFPRRRGEKRIPEIQRAHFDLPVERHRALLSPRRRRNAQRKRCVVLSRP